MTIGMDLATITETTKKQEFDILIEYCIEDIKGYQSCKEHANENAYYKTSCKKCYRDLILLKHIQTLAVILRFEGNGGPRKTNKTKQNNNKI